MQRDTPGKQFLPSEICRLVLGFLKDGNYTNTYRTFLQECHYLWEYQLMLQRGQEFPTTIMGQSLTNMLDEYARLKLHTSLGAINVNASATVGGEPSTSSGAVSTSNCLILPRDASQSSHKPLRALNQVSRTRALHRGINGLPSRAIAQTPVNAARASGLAQSLFSSEITVTSDDSEIELNVVDSEDQSSEVPCTSTPAVMGGVSLRGIIPALHLEETPTSGFVSDISSLPASSQQSGSGVTQRHRDNCAFPQSDCDVTSHGVTRNNDVARHSDSGVMPQSNNGVIRQSNSDVARHGSTCHSDRGVLGHNASGVVSQSASGVKPCELGVSSVPGRRTGGRREKNARAGRGRPRAGYGVRPSRLLPDQARNEVPSASGAGARQSPSAQSSRISVASSTATTQSAGPSSVVQPAQTVTVCSSHLVLSSCAGVPGASSTQLPSSLEAASKRRKKPPRRRSDVPSEANTSGGSEPVPLARMINSSQFVKTLADSINYCLYNSHKHARTTTTTTATTATSTSTTTITATTSTTSTTTTTVQPCRTVGAASNKAAGGSEGSRPVPSTSAAAGVVASSHDNNSLDEEFDFLNKDMTGDTVSKIASMASSDPLFNELFTIFSTDHEEFLRIHSKQGSPMTPDDRRQGEEGLHTPPPGPPVEEMTLGPAAGLTPDVLGPLPGPEPSSSSQQPTTLSLLSSVSSGLTSVSSGLTSVSADPRTLTLSFSTDCIDLNTVPAFPAISDLAEDHGTASQHRPGSTGHRHSIASEEEHGPVPGPSCPQDTEKQAGVSAVGSSPGRSEKRGTVEVVRSGNSARSGGSVPRSCVSTQQAVSQPAHHTPVVAASVTAEGKGGGVESIKHKSSKTIVNKSLTSSEDAPFKTGTALSGNSELPSSQERAASVHHSPPAKQESKCDNDISEDSDSISLVSEDSDSISLVSEDSDSAKSEQEQEKRAHSSEQASQLQQRKPSIGGGVDNVQGLGQHSKTSHSEQNARQTSHSEQNASQTSEQNARHTLHSELNAHQTLHSGHNACQTSHSRQRARHTSHSEQKARQTSQYNNSSQVTVESESSDDVDGCRPVPDSRTSGVGSGESVERLDTPADMTSPSHRAERLDTPADITSTSHRAERLDTPADMTSTSHRAERLDTPADMTGLSHRAERLDTPADMTSTSHRAERLDTVADMTSTSHKEERPVIHSEHNYSVAGRGESAHTINVDDSTNMSYASSCPDTPRAGDLELFPPYSGKLVTMAAEDSADASGVVSFDGTHGGALVVGDLVGIQRPQPRPPRYSALRQGLVDSGVPHVGHTTPTQLPTQNAEVMAKTTEKMVTPQLIQNTKKEERTLTVACSSDLIVTPPLTQNTEVETTPSIEDSESEETALTPSNQNTSEMTSAQNSEVLTPPPTQNSQVPTSVSQTESSEQCRTVALIPEWMNKIWATHAAAAIPPQSDGLVQSDGDHNSKTVQSEGDHNSQTVQSEGDHNSQIVQSEVDHNSQIVQSKEHNTQTLQTQLEQNSKNVQYEADNSQTVWYEVGLKSKTVQPETYPNSKTIQFEAKHNYQTVESQPEQNPHIVETKADHNFPTAAEDTVDREEDEEAGAEASPQGKTAANRTEPCESVVHTAGHSHNAPSRTLVFVARAESGTEVSPLAATVPCSQQTSPAAQHGASVTAASSDASSHVSRSCPPVPVSVAEAGPCPVQTVSQAGQSSHQSVMRASPLTQQQQEGCENNQRASIKSPASVLGPRSPLSEVSPQKRAQNAARKASFSSDGVSSSLSSSPSVKTSQSSYVTGVVLSPALKSAVPVSAAVINQSSAVVGSGSASSYAQRSPLTSLPLPLHQSPAQTYNTLPDTEATISPPENTSDNSQSSAKELHQSATKPSTPAGETKTPLSAPSVLGCGESIVDKVVTRDSHSGDITNDLSSQSLQKMDSTPRKQDATAPGVCDSLSPTPKSRSSGSATKSLETSQTPRNAEQMKVLEKRRLFTANACQSPEGSSNASTALGEEPRKQGAQRVTTPTADLGHVDNNSQDIRTCGSVKHPNRSAERSQTPTGEEESDKGQTTGEDVHVGGDGVEDLYTPAQLPCTPPRPQASMSSRAVFLTPPRAGKGTPQRTRTPGRPLPGTPGSYYGYSPIKSPYSPVSAKAMFSPRRSKMITEPIPEELYELSDSNMSGAGSESQCSISSSVRENVDFGGEIEGCGSPPPVTEGVVLPLQSPAAAHSAGGDTLGHVSQRPFQELRGGSENTNVPAGSLDIPSHSPPLPQAPSQVEPWSADIQMPAGSSTASVAETVPCAVLGQQEVESTEDGVGALNDEEQNSTSRTSISGMSSFVPVGTLEIVHHPLTLPSVGAGQGEGEGQLVNVGDMIEATDNLSRHSASIHSTHVEGQLVVEQAVAGSSSESPDIAHSAGKSGGSAEAGSGSGGDVFISPGPEDACRTNISNILPQDLAHFLDMQIQMGQLHVPSDLTTDLTLHTTTTTPVKATSTSTTPQPSPRKSPRKTCVRQLTAELGQFAALSRDKAKSPKKTAPAKCSGKAGPGGGKTAPPHIDGLLGQQRHFASVSSPNSPKPAEPEDSVREATKQSERILRSVSHSSTVANKSSKLEICPSNMASRSSKIIATKPSQISDKPQIASKPSKTASKPFKIASKPSKIASKPSKIVKANCASKTPSVSPEDKNAAAWREKLTRKTSRRKRKPAERQRDPSSESDFSIHSCTGSESDSSSPPPPPPPPPQTENMADEETAGFSSSDDLPLIEIAKKLQSASSPANPPARLKTKTFDEQVQTEGEHQGSPLQSKGREESQHYSSKAIPTDSVSSESSESPTPVSADLPSSKLSQDPTPVSANLPSSKLSQNPTPMSANLPSSKSSENPTPVSANLPSSKSSENPTPVSADLPSSEPQPVSNLLKKRPIARKNLSLLRPEFVLSDKAEVENSEASSKTSTSDGSTSAEVNMCEISAENPTQVSSDLPSSKSSDNTTPLSVNLLSSEPEPVSQLIKKRPIARKNLSLLRPEFVLNDKAQVANSEASSKTSTSDGSTSAEVDVCVMSDENADSDQEELLTPQSFSVRQAIITAKLKGSKSKNAAHSKTDSVTQTLESSASAVDIGKTSSNSNSSKLLPAVSSATSKIKAHSEKTKVKKLKQKKEGRAEAATASKKELGKESTRPKTTQRPEKLMSAPKDPGSAKQKDTASATREAAEPKASTLLSAETAHSTIVVKQGPSNTAGAKQGSSTSDSATEVRQGSRTPGISPGITEGSSAEPDGQAGGGVQPCGVVQPSTPIQPFGPYRRITPTLISKTTTSLFPSLRRRQRGESSQSLQDWECVATPSSLYARSPEMSLGFSPTSPTILLGQLPAKHQPSVSQPVPKPSKVSVPKVSAQKEVSAGSSRANDDPAVITGDMNPQPPSSSLSQCDSSSSYTEGKPASATVHKQSENRKRKRVSSGDGVQSEKSAPAADETQDRSRKRKRSGADDAKSRGNTSQCSSTSKEMAPPQSSKEQGAKVRATCRDGSTQCKSGFRSKVPSSSAAADAEHPTEGNADNSSVCTRRLRSASVADRTSGPAAGPNAAEPEENQKSETSKQKSRKSSSDRNSKERKSPSDRNVKQRKTSSDRNSKDSPSDKNSKQRKSSLDRNTRQTTSTTDGSDLTERPVNSTSDDNTILYTVLQQRTSSRKSRVRKNTKQPKDPHASSKSETKKSKPCRASKAKDKTAEGKTSSEKSCQAHNIAEVSEADRGDVENGRDDDDDDDYRDQACDSFETEEAVKALEGLDVLQSQDSRQAQAQAQQHQADTSSISEKGLAVQDIQFFPDVSHSDDEAETHQDTEVRAHGSEKEPCLEASSEQHTEFFPDVSQSGEHHSQFFPDISHSDDEAETHQDSDILARESERGPRVKANRDEQHTQFFPDISHSDDEAETHQDTEVRAHGSESGPRVEAENKPPPQCNNQKRAERPGHGDTGGSGIGQSVDTSDDFILPDIVPQSLSKTSLTSSSMSQSNSSRKRKKKKSPHAAKAKGKKRRVAEKEKKKSLNEVDPVFKQPLPLPVHEDSQKEIYEQSQKSPEATVSAGGTSSDFMSMPFLGDVSRSPLKLGRGSRWQGQEQEPLNIIRIADQRPSAPNPTPTPTSGPLAPAVDGIQIINRFSSLLDQVENQGGDGTSSGAGCSTEHHQHQANTTSQPVQLQGFVDTETGAVHHYLSFPQHVIVPELQTQVDPHPQHGGPDPQLVKDLEQMKKDKFRTRTLKRMMNKTKDNDSLKPQKRNAKTKSTRDSDSLKPPVRRQRTRKPAASSPASPSSTSRNQASVGFSQTELGLPAVKADHAAGILRKVPISPIGHNKYRTILPKQSTPVSFLKPLMPKEKLVVAAGSSSDQLPSANSTVAALNPLDAAMITVLPELVAGPTPGHLVVQLQSSVPVSVSQSQSCGAGHPSSSGTLLASRQADKVREGNASDVTSPKPLVIDELFSSGAESSPYKKLPPASTANTAQSLKGRFSKQPVKNCEQKKKQEGKRKEKETNNKAEPRAKAGSSKVSKRLQLSSHTGDRQKAKKKSGGSNRSQSPQDQGPVMGSGDQEDAPTAQQMFHQMMHPAAALVSESECDSEVGNWNALSTLFPTSLSPLKGTGSVLPLGGPSMSAPQTVNSGGSLLTTTALSVPTLKHLERPAQTVPSTSRHLVEPAAHAWPSSSPAGQISFPVAGPATASVSELTSGTIQQQGSDSQATSSFSAVPAISTLADDLPDLTGAEVSSAPAVQSNGLPAVQLQLQDSEPATPGPSKLLSLCPASLGFESPRQEAARILVSMGGGCKASSPLAAVEEGRDSMSGQQRGEASKQTDQKRNKSKKKLESGRFPNKLHK